MFLPIVSEEEMTNKEKIEKKKNLTRLIGYSSKSPDERDKHRTRLKNINQTQYQTKNQEKKSRQVKERIETNKNKGE